MISFQFYLFYVCAIAFNYILPEIWFDNNLSLSWKQRNAYIFKKYEFSPVHIVSPIAVSKSFPYNLDIKRQSNKSMCTVRLVSHIDIKWTVIYVLVIEGNSFNCVLFSLSLRSKIKRLGFVLSNLPICQLLGTPVHCLVMTQDFYLRWAPLCNL